MKYLPLLFPLALAPATLAALRPADTHDLQPHFVEGLAMSADVTLSFEMEVDEVSVDMGGFDPLGGDVEAEVQFEAIEQGRAEILEAEEGMIRKMRASTIASSSEVQGSYGVMGEGDSFNESDEGPLVGYTLEVTFDEDGEVESVEVVEGDESELDDDALDNLDFENPFDGLLPEDPVSVGDTWEIGERFAEKFTEAMETEAAGSEEGAQMMEVMDLMSEYLTTRAQGSLVSVDDGQAEIEWTISILLEIDDIFELAEGFAEPEDLEQIPEDAEATMEVAFELVGSGTFDLEARQLVRAELEGDMTFEAFVLAAQDGMTMEASSAASGAVAIELEVTVE